MIDMWCTEESLNPKHVYHTIKNRIEFIREHPNYFNADGLVAFVGPQGSGKTLSAVNYVYNLMEKYPAAKLCTNLMLRDYPICEFEQFKLDHVDDLFFQSLNDEQKYYHYLDVNRVFSFNNHDDLQRYSNGENGLIYLIDEIQLYFNSLESKNINPEVMTQISQQRKQRKHIVCTSQVFGRMAKPLREQFSCVIICKKYFGLLQCNRMLDRDSLEDDDSTGTNLKGNVKRKFWWFHQPEFYGRYDTYYVIDRNKFVSGDEQKNIYSNDFQVRMKGDK